MIVIVGGLRRRLEHRNCRSPMIVARTAARVIVQGREAGEIFRRNHPFACDVGKVAGKLRPEGGLAVEILPHPDHRPIRERRADGGNGRAHFGKIAAETHDRHMVLAVDRLRSQ